MIMDKFEIHEDKAIEEIKKRKAKTVLIQLPEGLKKEGMKIAKELENKTGAEIIISGDSCWGACDIPLNDAKTLGVDLVIHFGHSQFTKLNYPIVYINIEDATDIKPLIRKSIKELKEYKKIGLVASVQHLHQLNVIKKYLEENGKEIIIPAKKGYSFYDGQVTGCEYNSLKFIEDKIECYLVVGNQFHSLGAAMSVTKPVYLIDVYNNEIINMDKLKDKIIKQRFRSIEKIKEAKNVGIIIGTKQGQRFGNYKTIKDKLEKLGKNVAVMTMGEITEEKLINFYNIEGFIELACPRIAVEDYEKYGKPIVTFREALVVLGEMKWEELIGKGFL